MLIPSPTFRSSKKTFESFEKERFLAVSSPTEDPIIPEIDDVQNDIEDLEIPTAPQKNYKDISIDLLKSGPINPLEDTDLSLLLECLEPESDLDEPDEVWNWSQTFTKVSAEINS